MDQKYIKLFKIAVELDVLSEVLDSLESAQVAGTPFRQWAEQLIAATRQDPGYLKETFGPYDIRRIDDEVRIEYSTKLSSGDADAR